MTDLAPDQQAILDEWRDPVGDPEPPWASDEPPELEPPEPTEATLDQEERAHSEQDAIYRRAHDMVRERKAREIADRMLADERAAGHDFDAQFLDRNQLSDLPAIEPLIDRVLPRHVYALLTGRDQSFKSLALVDWLCCLATGKPWQGHAVTPTRVLYIVGEGAYGLAKRIEAWEYAWGTTIPQGALTIRKAALNMHQPGPAFDHLLGWIERGRYGLVGVDTLRRVSGAADGNGSEMGLVIDNLDRVKQATNDGSVLVVAHTDKGDHDTRGYSGIEDDADIVWHAKRDQMLLTLELKKMKDGPDGRQIHLEAATTLDSLILTGTSGAPPPNTTEGETKILTTLTEMSIGGVPGGQLQRATGLPVSTFYRLIKKLHQAGQIINVGTPRSKIWDLPALPIDSHDLPPNKTTPDLHVSHDSHDSQPLFPLLPPTPTPLRGGSEREKDNESDHNTEDQA